MLKSLTEQYALRAREYSDSVAGLGRYHDIGPEVLKRFKEIKRKRGLCRDIEEKFDLYIANLEQSSTDSRIAG